MAFFLQSAGNQFVRSPGKWRDAQTGPARFCWESSIRLLYSESALATFFLSADNPTPFAGVPKDTGGSYLRHFFEQEFYGQNGCGRGRWDQLEPVYPGNIWTSGLPVLSSGLAYPFTAGCEWIFDAGIITPNSQNASKNVINQSQEGYNQTTFFLSQQEAGTVVENTRYIGRISRFSIEETANVWIAHGEVYVHHYGPQHFPPYQLDIKYSIRAVQLLSQFSLSARQVIDLPIVRGGDGNAVLNMASFAIVEETPAQWTARTGIPVS